MHLTSSGAPNESFPVINVITASGGFAVQLIVNEQQVFSDGGISFVKANGLHMVLTDSTGTVILDLIVNHVFAGIHGAKHLPSDDSIGA